MRPDAAKMTAEALIGADAVNVTVGGKDYRVSPPTIKRIVGAGMFLSDIGDKKNIKDISQEFGKYGNLTKALSWFVQGDECLADELESGTLEEVLNGIEVAIQLIDVRNFIKLSTLVKNVKMLIAKQR